MKKNILLDFDGTIVDFSKRSYRCYQYCLKLLGINDCLDFSTYWKAKRNRTPMSIILNDYSQKVEEFHSLWMEHIELLDFLAFDQLFPNVIDWFTEKKKTYNFFLITKRQYSDRLSLELNNLQLSSFFSQIIVVPENQKKSSAIREIQHDNHFRNLEFSYWIGDTESDILSAQELDIPAIAVTCGVRNHEILKQYAPTRIYDYVANISI